MNNEKLKPVLEYCLANLKHPETPTVNFWNNQVTYVDGYPNPAPLKTAEQILKDAEVAFKAAEIRATKIKEYENCIENIKLILNELESWNN